MTESKIILNRPKDFIVCSDYIGAKVQKARLGKYLKENMEKFLKMHNIKNIFCPDCKISKMKRIPHNKQTPKANEIFEVIHSDIIGPINDSITGMKYIITFMDEKSHKSWIFLMDKKKSAIKIIINFLMLIIYLKIKR